MDPVIRKMRRSDRAEVNEICYLTGLTGESLEGKDIFNDKKLFGLLFCQYYPLYEIEHCFVAEVDGRVVGYIIGTDNSIQQEKRFMRKMVPRILLRMLFYSFWFHRESFWKVLTFSKAEEMGNIHEISKQFPAHLHINLHPDYQGIELGGKMLTSFEEHMRSQGIKGIHLGTSNYNTHAIRFYKKHGYSVASEDPSSLWEERENMTSIIFTKQF